MNKIVTAIVLALLGFGAIGAVVLMNRDKAVAPAPSANLQQNNDTDNAPTSNEEAAPDTSQPLTSDEVAKHSSASDCWTIVEGKVYNITSYVRSHPGGNEILRACGTDATTLFTTRTTTDGEEVGSGTPHSSTAERTLSQFLVGDLAN